MVDFADLDLAMRSMTESTSKKTPLHDALKDIDKKEKTAPPIEPNAKEEKAKKAKREDPIPYDIGTSTLSDWFPRHKDSVPHINNTNIIIPGVDPSETIILTSPHPDGGLVPAEITKDGITVIVDVPRRELFPFKSADSMPLLDSVPLDMELFNSGYRVKYSGGRDAVLDCYGSKAYMIISQCYVYEGLEIPFHWSKIKKDAKGIFKRKPDAEKIKKALKRKCDKETLIVMYTQSRKVIDDFKTNKDAVEWLLKRKVGTTDIKHLIQLDEAVIALLS